LALADEAPRRRHHPRILRHRSCDADHRRGMRAGISCRRTSRASWAKF